MRIKESQFRALIRKEIKALLEAEEVEDSEAAAEETPEPEAEPEVQPEEKPKEEKPEEEGPSKATQLAQKLLQTIKRDSELSSAEGIEDMVIEFFNELNFSNETKLAILKTIKIATIR